MLTAARVYGHRKARQLHKHTKLAAHPTQPSKPESVQPLRHITSDAKSIGFKEVLKLFGFIAK